jgi:predicted small lipoprotein YifL
MSKLLRLAVCLLALTAIAPVCGCGSNKPQQLPETEKVMPPGHEEALKKMQDAQKERMEKEKK